MNIRTLIVTLTLLATQTSLTIAATDYKESEEFLTLRNDMHRAFNEGDSTAFFRSVALLEDYLLKQDDLHAYYTQRCNEIVFLMNREKIYEAYKLAIQLSKELREKKLDKEMYMAVNMMGHISRYCGNKENAKKCFREVIERMEAAGYRESMPPIYMNIVNVEMDDDPEEALKMLNKAAEIAAETSPERVFDIETRRTVAYYNMGDKEKFLEGYKAYRKGVDEGLTSVHGRVMEVYYQAAMGNTDKAAQMAMEEMGDDSYESLARIYRDAGRWQEAYEALKKEVEASDSINSLILSNSMQGIHDELKLYEAEREASRTRTMALTAIIALLSLLVALLAYIVMSRRRHLRQLKNAYDHALQSDRMKTAFIRNVSHEVRTPLNIIGGYAQVLSDPELEAGPEERREIARTVTGSTHQITSLIDKMLMLSLAEATNEVERNDRVKPDCLVEQLVESKREQIKEGVSLSVKSEWPSDKEITTNEAMLKNIVGTLLDNAAIHTQQGGITISIADRANNRLGITVEDTGSGIVEADRERIFEQFVKLDEFKEGLGLGLPLCRKLAQRLGGDVSLDDTYKEGARFIVEIDYQ